MCHRCQNSVCEANAWPTSCFKAASENRNVRASKSKIKCGQFAFFPPSTNGIFLPNLIIENGRTVWAQTEPGECAQQPKQPQLSGIMDSCKWWVYNGSTQWQGLKWLLCKERSTAQCWWSVYKFMGINADFRWSQQSSGLCHLSALMFAEEKHSAFWVTFCSRKQARKRLRRKKYSSFYLIKWTLLLLLFSVLSQRHLETLLLKESYRKAASRIYKCSLLFCK